MDLFCSIEPLFSSTKDRTIPSLGKSYANQELVEEKIQQIVQGRLSAHNVAGKKVLLKPNWVKHSSVDTDELCMRTHDNFLLATLKTILVMRPSEVLIGDAPIQGCLWGKVVSNELEKKVADYSSEYNTTIRIKDFRRSTFEPLRNNPVLERNPISDYLIFDLGKKSFLEPITEEGKNAFRVTHYDPDRMTDAHRPGVHKYCITKELFDADIVISLPKVKTHQKAGITAALKNIVGLNGDKDFLPHHRIGGTGFGGDCYPGKNYLRFWAEKAFDFANRRQGKLSFSISYKLGTVLWRLSFPGKTHQASAGWHGNDTTWRMVLDLNNIVQYGKADGTLANKPQRQLFSLSDGIVGGQGDGPLKPEPFPLGVIAFTNDSHVHDMAMALLMGLNTEKIPLLNNASAREQEDVTSLFWEGKKTSLAGLKEYTIKASPPPGWTNSL